jgi:hypothetical protein
MVVRRQLPGAYNVVHVDSWLILIKIIYDNILITKPPGNSNPRAMHSLLVDGH